MCIHILTLHATLIRLTGLLGVIVLCTVVWPAFLGKKMWVYQYISNHTIAI